MSDSNGLSDSGTNFASNGSRGTRSDILLDGASNTNFEPNGGATQVTYTPSAEVVDEFKVQADELQRAGSLGGIRCVDHPLKGRHHGPRSDDSLSEGC